MDFVVNALAAYYILANAIQGVLCLLAYSRVRRHHQETHALDNPAEDPHYTAFLTRYRELPTVSILVPAFNEEPVVVEALEALLGLYYPKLEVLLIDDGSQDGTFPAAAKAFALREAPAARHSLLSPARIQSTWVSQKDSRLCVIRQENGGKATALNTGIDHARGEFIVTLDADTIAEEDALIRLMPYFLRDPDLLGASGVIRILNGTHYEHRQVARGRLPGHPLALFQVIEYLRAFYIGRLGWCRLKATILLSGAFSVFRKSPIVEVGGFEPHSITEDLEIALRILQHARRKAPRSYFSMIPEPVCWTQAPQSLEHLKRQRIRWQRGLIETALRHRAFLFAARSGWVGWGSFPYLIFFEGLAPLAGLFAFAALGIHHLFHPDPVGHLHQLYLIAVVGVLYSWLLSAVAFYWVEVHFRRHVKKEPLALRLLTFFKLVSASFFEMFLFHPLVAFWKLRALLLYPFEKTSWGAKPRAKISEPAENKAPPTGKAA